jgi:hypothetical protein
MRILRKPSPVGDVGRGRLKPQLRPSDERRVELETLRLLLTSMKKRHGWDRVKCTITTGIPAFWLLMIALRPYLPNIVATSVPPWLASQIQPLFQDIPAVWTIAVSLAIAGFQWRNVIHYQRRAIPLVREMYERALTKRDPELLTMLGEVLRVNTLRAFFRSVLHSLFPKSR